MTSHRRPVIEKQSKKIKAGRCVGMGAASTRTPWWASLTPVEVAEAARAADIGTAALRGLAQSAKAEALARMMAVLVAEVGASAAVSGLDFTQRDILLTRLEASVVDRARMLSALEASHG